MRESRSETTARTADFHCALSRGIKVWRFFVVSQVGMLVGTVVYVNAGTQLASLSSAKDVLSPGLLASFVALGVVPLIARKILQALKKKRAGASSPAAAAALVAALGAGLLGASDASAFDQTHAD